MLGGGLGAFCATAGMGGAEAGWAAGIAGRECEGVAGVATDTEPDAAGALEAPRPTTPRAAIGPLFCPLNANCRVTASV